MLYRANEIIGCELAACDGKVGHINDLYFDDVSWTIRYFVVNTGGWLSGRDVLIIPEKITGVDPSRAVFKTDMLRKQVEESPPVEKDLPVSRQYEQQLHAYYGWTPYWTYPMYPWPGMYTYPPLAGLGTYPYPEEARARETMGLPKDMLEDVFPKEPRGDPHLRSCREVAGYGLRANDDDLGHVEDFLIDPRLWRITHLIADTRNFWPGKSVVIDVGAVGEVMWDERRVGIDLTKEQIRNAPPYDREMQIDDRYKADISRYYTDLLSGSRRTREPDPDTLAPHPGP